MKRLTSNDVWVMDMHGLALNQAYIGQDGWAQYREYPEHECSVCDLIRAAAETLAVELPMMSDEALSDLMLDWLQYGDEEPEGILAILYRALWAMAELRERLCAYEDTGLGPEEFKEAQEAVSPIPFGRFHDIMEAERVGLLVLLSKTNDPLTLEELREMDGEKIFIRYINGFYSDEDGAYFGKFEQLVRECEGALTACELPLEHYGKTWLAYRRKLEAIHER